MAGISPVQRTMRHLRLQGCKCAVVEKWNAYAGPHGIRQDLFGIIDIIVLDPERGVVGLQVCGADFAAHWRKLTQDNAQATIDWLETPGTAIEIWGWRKVKLKRGGKAMRWEPRIAAVTIDDCR